MSLINIAELSKSFSEKYLQETSGIPWKEIRGLRNIAAHRYEILRPANIGLTIARMFLRLKTICWRIRWSKAIAKIQLHFGKFSFRRRVAGNSPTKGLS